jgi:hypothetical protein
VTAPVLLIVGAQDEVALDVNRRAQAELRCENDLTVVPGAGHLFEEPGTLDAAAGLARDWFTRHLTRDPPKTGSCLSRISPTDSRSSRCRMRSRRSSRLSVRGVLAAC